MGGWWAAANITTFGEFFLFFFFISFDIIRGVANRKDLCAEVWKIRTFYESIFKFMEGKDWNGEKFALIICENILWYVTQI